VILCPHYACRNLDESYTATRNFIDEWLQQLEQRQEFHPTTVAEALALNAFVSVNEEGLRKIIKKHDKNFPDSRYSASLNSPVAFNLATIIGSSTAFCVNTAADI
jgi:SPX domain protein involved in polyphosphate accumulation